MEISHPAAVGGTDTIPLVRLAGELRALTGRGAGYHALWRAIVSGSIPAEQSGRQWHVRRTDLPAIAQTLGLARDAA